MSWDVQFINFTQRFNIDPCVAEAEVDVPCLRVLTQPPRGDGESSEKGGKAFRSLAWHRNRLLVAGADQCLHVYDVTRGKWQQPQQLGVTKLKHLDGRLLLVCGHAVRLLSPRLEVTRAFVGHEANVTTLAVEGRALYTASMDGSARQFLLQPEASAERVVELAGLPVALATHAGDVQPAAVLQGHTGPVSAVVASREWVCSSSSDKTVRVWDRQTGECRRILLGHVGWVLQLLLDGNTLYSASNDGTVRAWNVTTGKCLRLFACPSNYPHMIQLHQGYLLAAADCRVACWRTTSSKILHTFEGHELKVRSFLAQGSLLFTASSDMTVRVWEIKSGACLAVLRGHCGPANCLLVHGSSLYSTSDDGTVRQWDLAQLESRLAPAAAAQLYNEDIALEDEDIDAFVAFMRQEALKVEAVKVPAEAEINGDACDQRKEHKCWQLVGDRVGTGAPLFKEGILMSHSSDKRYERRWVTLHFPALYIFRNVDDELPLRVVDIPADAVVAQSTHNALAWQLTAGGSSFEFVASSAELAAEWAAVVSHTVQILAEEKDAAVEAEEATVKFDMTTQMEQEPALEQFPAPPSVTVTDSPPGAQDDGASSSASRGCEDVTNASGREGASEKRQRRAPMRLRNSQRLSDLFPRDFIEKEALSKGEEAVETQLRKDARRLSQLLLKTQLQTHVSSVARSKKRASKQYLASAPEPEEAPPQSFEATSHLQVPQAGGRPQRPGSIRLLDVIHDGQKEEQKAEGDTPDPAAVKVMLLWIRYKRVRRFKRLLEQQEAEQLAERAKKQALVPVEARTRGSTVVFRKHKRTRSLSSGVRVSSQLPSVSRRTRPRGAPVGGSSIGPRPAMERQLAESSGDEDEDSGERGRRRRGRACNTTWSHAPLGRMRPSVFASFIHRSTSSAVASFSTAEERFSTAISKKRKLLTSQGSGSDSSASDEDDAPGKVHMPYYHEDLLLRKPSLSNE